MDLLPSVLFRAAGRPVALLSPPIRTATSEIDTDGGGEDLLAGQRVARHGLRIRAPCAVLHMVQEMTCTLFK